MGFWNIPGWPLPEEWSAFWAALTFFVTAGAATAALVQLQAYFRDREAQSRPYIVVDYSFRSTLLQVEVRNISQTLASNVRLTVDVPFRSSIDEMAHVLNDVTGPNYSIQQLAPSRVIRWSLDRAPDYFKEKEFPRVYRVTATYEDARASRRPTFWKVWEKAETPVYSEVFELSIDQWSEAVADADYDNKNWNTLNRMEQHLKKVAEKR